MKRTVYLICFTFLGILVAFIIHALVEIWYIKLLVRSFSTYGFGLSWATWFRLHWYWSVSMLLLGACLGYIKGKYWWQQIYVLKKYGKPKF